jgi:hypothetical protein
MQLAHAHAQRRTGALSWRAPPRPRVGAHAVSRLTLAVFSAHVARCQPLHERDAELLEELRHTFRVFVRDNYPSVRVEDVIKITASHYFGIVPLHVNRYASAPHSRPASARTACLREFEGR